MTTGQLFESITGKSASLIGVRANLTAFREVPMKEIGEILQEFGYESKGEETFYSAQTGELLKGLVFVGPVYYQVLKHQVEDKKHGRARGIVHHLYRQPTEGRSRDGGLRLGKPFCPSLTIKVRLVRGIRATTSNCRETLKFMKRKMKKHPRKLGRLKKMSAKVIFVRAKVVMEKGFEGLYYIRENGVFSNIKTRHVYKPRLCNGYFIASLCKTVNDKRVCLSVSSTDW